MSLWTNSSVGILNGAIRESLLVPATGETTGRAISTLILSAAIVLTSWLTITWIDPSNAADAALVGGIWLGLTLAFEFLFGHFVAGKSWGELLLDYNVFRGRIWILVLLVTAVSPYLVARVRGLWT